MTPISTPGCSRTYNTLDSSNRDDSTKEARMNAPKSFHGNGAVSAAHSKKASLSTHDLSLGRKDAASPEQAIRLMRIAAKTLERRAAELEFERRAAELGLERKDKEAAEKAKRRRRKERKLVSSLKVNSQESKKSSDEERESRDKEIKALLRWSTGFEHGSALRSRKVNVSPPKPSSEHQSRMSKSTTEIGASSSPTRRRGFSLGQVAQRSDMYEPSSRDDALIKIGRLKVGDGAWVKRTDKIFTYATLKEKETSPEAMLVFAVNDRASTKKFPMTHWAKFVRLVSEEKVDPELEEEEKEIDIMFGDEPGELTGYKPIQTSYDLRRKVKDEHAHKHKNSLVPVSSKQTAISAVTLPSKDSSPKGTNNNKAKERAIDLQDHEISMYTLGLPNAEASKPRPSKAGAKSNVKEERVIEKRLVTFTPEPTAGLSNNIVTSKDSSSKRSGSKDGTVRKMTKERATVLQDHEVSMYTLGLPNSEVDKPHAKSKVKDGRVPEERLVTFTPVPTAGSSNTVISKDSSSRGSDSKESLLKGTVRQKAKEGAIKLQDHEVSMYTLGLPNSEVDEPHSSGMRPQSKVKKDHTLEKSLVTFASEQTSDSFDVVPSKYSSSKGSGSEGRERAIARVHNISMSTSGVQDESSPPILRHGSTSEIHKTKPHVSFEISQDGRQKSARSSMPSTSEALDVASDVDAEKTGESNELVDAGKIMAILERSSTHPILHEIIEQYEDQNEPSSLSVRPLVKYRPVYLSEQSEKIDQIKEGIQVVTKTINTKKSFVGSGVEKNKLRELDMGGSFPKLHGRVKEESFYSALKTIHRRSSDLMPTTTSIALNLS